MVWDQPLASFDRLRMRAFLRAIKTPLILMPVEGPTTMPAIGS